MADSDNKPKPAALAESTPVAADPKPAARSRASRAAAAKPVRKRTPAAAKATTAVARKTAARPVAKAAPTTKKAPPVAKAAHEPAPFVAKASKTAKPGKAKKAAMPTKAKKAKLVRDSFTMPEPEYALIATLKKRCLNAGVSAKKSEILRAAVANLAKLSDTSVLAAVRRLEAIKTGRPAKGSK